MQYRSSRKFRGFHFRLLAGNEHIKRRSGRHELGARLSGARLGGRSALAAKDGHVGSLASAPAYGVCPIQESGRASKESSPIYFPSNHLLDLLQGCEVMEAYRQGSLRLPFRITSFVTRHHTKFAKSGPCTGFFQGLWRVPPNVCCSEVACATKKAQFMFYQENQGMPYDTHRLASHVEKDTTISATRYHNESRFISQTEDYTVALLNHFVVTTGPIVMLRGQSISLYIGTTSRYRTHTLKTETCKTLTSKLLLKTFIHKKSWFPLTIESANAGGAAVASNPCTCLEQRKYQDSTKSPEYESFYYPWNM